MDYKISPAEEMPKINRTANSETQRIVDTILSSKEEAIKIELKDDKEAKRLQNRLRNYQHRTGQKVYTALRIKANVVYLKLRE